MTFNDWFWIVGCGFIALVSGKLLWPLGRLATRDPVFLPGFVVWTVLVGLIGSVPVALLLSWGRLDWYPQIVTGLVPAIGLGFGWTRRKQIVEVLRGDARDRRDRSQ